MKAIASRSRRAAAAALIALIAFVTAGCGLADLSGAAVNHSPGPAVRLTEHVPAAALVIVADRTVTGTDLSRTVAATAQPNEYLDILRPGAQPGPVMAAESPSPRRWSSRESPSRRATVRAPTSRPSTASSSADGTARLPPGQGWSGPRPRRPQPAGLAASGSRAPGLGRAETWQTRAPRPRVPSLGWTRRGAASVPGACWSCT